MSFAVREVLSDDGKSTKVVFREIKDIDTQAEQFIRNGFFNYMKALRTRANAATLKRDKRGRVYRIKTAKGSRLHKSSAPGQSHANMRGNLRRSLSWKVFGADRATFGYGVSTAASKQAPVYAGAIEFGFVFSKPFPRELKARPTLRNAVDLEPNELHFDKAFDEWFGPEL